MRNIQTPQAVINNLGVNQIIDITDQLPVNPNYTWSQLAGRRDLNALTTIVLHHDAIKKSLTSNLQLATNIANSHIRSKSNEPKGDMFPYHIWIRNGQAYQTNNILDRTYGAASNNAYTVHVCVSGEYAFTDALTDADRKALLAVCITLSQLLPSYVGIKSHSELNPTSCPGYDYNSIKTDVEKTKAIIAAQSDSSQQQRKMYIATEQHKYLYGLYQAEPDKYKWLEPYLLKMHDVTKEYGMFFE